MPTPTWRYAALSDAVGRDVVVKHENMNPTGSFKVRGGLTLAASLGADERRAGLVTCSTGNHAQSIAYAARVAGTGALIVIPHSAPSVKVDAVRALGAEVVLEGERLPEAAAHARTLAAERGMRFVDPGNEPAMIHGHATVYLELLQAHPEIAEVVIPIGSGSGAAGACLVRDVIAPHVRIIGVQAVGASAAYESWVGEAEVSQAANTRVSGLATGCGFATPQSVLRGSRGTAGDVGLAAFELVPDDAIDDAAHLLATHAHLLAEGAAAASLAGLRARQKRDGEAQGGSVAVVVTGGNVSTDEWKRLASR
ncbi:pyridoxal-phosphate dependent enzyme [Dermacoccus abyssi]|uniref:threonine ammonia-lyase n=1 Tax=Dermacoccus abyssi TaxID=322596 RepID=A0A417Z0X5_9MICO|nr:pyridoxal-phosphate dependent enzyme [Dermacoccus abyssi]